MEATIRIRWPDVENEQGRPMLWFGSWLVGADGSEGGWFHSARGGAEGAYSIPAGATGVRIRRWPNDGLEPEYADHSPLEDITELVATDLDFESRQQFSLLPEYFG